MEPFTFRCSCCGREITGLPDLAYDAPAHYHDLPQAERSARARLGDDLCTIDNIDNRDHFVRGVLLLPVQGTDQTFGFGVWVSLSAENYRRYVATFEDEDQSKLGAMFGWFCNRIPYYPDTLNLQSVVVPQDRRARPQVWISEVHANHPLYVEQRSGITKDRLGEIYGGEFCDRRPSRDE
ncbi:MAG TPA: DUF2199 domain-containing protein [Kiloniellales bacterium]